MNLILKLFCPRLSHPRTGCVELALWAAVLFALTLFLMCWAITTFSPH